MLNEQQRSAVEHIYGPLLIIAGAGSGKTTVLVDRIENMIQKHKIDPSEILAVTFTNKAATEMKERIEKKIGYESVYGLEMATFHSFCNKALKRDINFTKSEYTSSFNIADENQVNSYIKQIIKGKTKIQPNTFSGYISALKNELVDASMFVTEDFTSPFVDSEKVEVMISNWYFENPEHMELLGTVYRQYEYMMEKTNTMDFDDLILQTVKMFTGNPKILERYQEKFKYLMIDEYQDTNRSQYVLSKLLANKYRNIAVVGDDAQSIYAFRGSDIRNILNFDFDYSEAKVIKLEQNYRSTKTILQAANEVIAHNKNQKKKVLFTDNPEGEKITLLDTQYPEEESSIIASKILEIKERDNKSFSDFTILYRTNRQSARIEQALRFEGIPYFVYSGRSFFDIPEIRIIVKYLQFIHNQNNIDAFNEIIQVPKRRIADKTIEKIVAEFLSRDILDILENPDSIVRMQKTGKSESLQFVKLIKKLKDLSETLPVNELIEELLIELNFEEAVISTWLPGKQKEAVKNIEMLLEILVSKQQRDGKPILIREFVEEIALGSPKDAPEGEHVKLMTIHASKGLEFPVVFVTNMQENGFPNTMFKEVTPADIEEERRLAYVAITRAKELLFLSKHNYLVTKQGKTLKLSPSLFLSEFSRSLMRTEYL
ncbi:ATP-dependent DNA helicase PcrA [Bacillus cereus]|uniref:DNA 3'-5' helicase n=1 Tax=Bacillus cereus TaxID=1396 RepID=A0A9X6SY92_BACCE|nr:UvrD-helicase domain-containing protein [Bacillus cereus]PDZ97074.1 ATP-dependent DNA helicase PcrA [Bacillus cereus]